MLAGLGAPNVGTATTDSPDGARLDDATELVAQDVQADAANGQAVATRSD
jgi:hypothetical protein